MIGRRGQTKIWTNIVHMSTIAQHIETCALTQYIKNNGTRGEQDWQMMQAGFKLALSTWATCLNLSEHVLCAKSRLWKLHLPLNPAPQTNSQIPPPVSTFDLSACSFRTRTPHITSNPQVCLKLTLRWIETAILTFFMLSSRRQRTIKAFHIASGIPPSSQHAHLCNFIPRCVVVNICRPPSTVFLRGVCVQPWKTTDA